MTTVKTLWGPAAIGVANVTNAPTTQALNDADNSVAWTFNVPADGSITDVGLLLTAETGTSPAYNVGIVTVGTDGAPTSTAYGGSAVTSAQWTSAGWKWVPLSTAATANAGDWAAVRVYPGGSAPDGSNNVTVATTNVADGGLGYVYVVAWTGGAMGIPMAVKYATGAIYGFALSSNTVNLTYNSGSTPDEAGCKFQVPAAMACSGAKVGIYRSGYGSAATVDVVLYSAADAVLASATVGDKDYVDTSDYVNVFWDSVNLTANTDYRLIVKPTTGTNGNVTVAQWSFESAAAMAMFPEGTRWQWTQRTDAGAWTDTSTAITYAALWVSDITFVQGSGTAGAEWGFVG